MTHTDSLTAALDHRFSSRFSSVVLINMVLMLIDCYDGKCVSIIPVFTFQSKTVLNTK